jgi:hypothetical protein
LPTTLDTGRRQVSTLDKPARHPRRRNLAAEAEERADRRTYRLDVQHFMRTLAIKARLSA